MIILHVGLLLLDFNQTYFLFVCFCFSFLQYSVVFFYWFVYTYLQQLVESDTRPNSAKALNLMDAYMKHPEIDLSKKPSFKCRRKNQRTHRKPTEASLDWKPNAHKCWHRELNSVLIDANRGSIRFTDLLLLTLQLTYVLFVVPFCWSWLFPTSSLFTLPSLSYILFNVLLSTRALVLDDFCVLRQIHHYYYYYYFYWLATIML